MIEKDILIDFAFQPRGHVERIKDDMDPADGDRIGSLIK